MKYTKGPLTYPAQLQQLQERGLEVADPVSATRYLERLGYYRLMGYLFPFRVRGSDDFFAGATFEEAVSRYEFDQALRSLVMDGICHIEIAVRTAVTYHMAHKYGPFGYRDPANVACVKSQHTDWTLTVDGEVHRSRESFIEHYRAKYTQPAHPCVPLWMASEVMSFGTLSKFIHAMHSVDKKIIAAPFGVRGPVFVSWVHAICAVRNIVAHHGRMWNRVLGIRPMRPDSGPWQNMAQTFPSDKMYFLLLVVRTLLTSCTAGADAWRDRVSEHLRPLLAVEAHRLSMGAPPNWDDHPLWR